MEQLEIQATSLRYLTQTQPPPALAGDSATLPPLALPSVATATGAAASAATTPGLFGPASSPDMQTTPGSRQHAPAAASQSPGGGSSRAKRRADDDDSSTKQQRSKRNRYIAIACNECKRRKIKCNGETPCQRCGNLNLTCLYTPNCCGTAFKESEEYKQMADKMFQLQGQVEALAQTVGAMRQETQRHALNERLPRLSSSNVSLSPASSVPSMHRPEIAMLRPPPSGFRGGPTSTTFTVDVAKNTLRNMGYDNDTHEEPGAAAAMEGRTPHASPVLPPRLPSMATQPPYFHQQQPHSHQQEQPPQQELPPPPPPPPPPPLRDPIEDFDRDEMIRLCHIHEDEVGIMYPVVQIETVIEHAHQLTASWDGRRRRRDARGAARPPLARASPDPEADDIDLNDIPTLILKMILCCALAVEEHGNSERAMRLYESMQPIIDSMLMSEPSNIRNLPFLALTAGYRFLTNDEVLAWRVMGQVVRHCLEQGLHRREGLAGIADAQARQNAINTFWAAYVLDRRWSFGTGLPYVVHDDQVDPNLPMPDSPYSVAMVSYSRLSAKIWRLVDFFEPAVIRDLKRDAFEALDQEILQWYASCPEQVQVGDLERRQPSPRSYNLQRQQIWTRLRLNQMRIWLLTPVLHSANSINKNLDLAQKVVDLAKETIHYLSDLYTGSDLYARIQVFYHQFLTSAIAVLFLASTHQPVPFSAHCRDAFYTALDLVKDMSAKSWVSQRLWRTIRSLKAYAPRLGLQQHQQHKTEAAAAAAAADSPYHHRDDRSHDPSYHNIHDYNHHHHHHHGHTILPPPPPPPPIPSHRASSLPCLGPSPGSGPFGRLLDQSPGYAASLSFPASPVGTGMATTPTSAANAAVQQPPPPPPPAIPPPEEPQPNGVQIQTEMTLIFEGLMGINGGGGNAPLDPSSPSFRGERLRHEVPWREREGGAAQMTEAGPSVFEQVKNLF